MRELASLFVEGRVEEVGRVHEQLADLWEQNGFPPSDEYAASLVLEEALSNIIRHGGIPGKSHSIIVRFVLDGDVIQIELEDDGRPFDPLQSAPAVNLSENLSDRRPGGLGVFLVRSLFDEVIYEFAGGRNRLRLRKQLTLEPNGASGAG